MKTPLLPLRNTLTALILFLFLMPNANFAQAPSLGSASSFVLFTSAGSFSNIGASTVVTGDVGTNVGAFSAFPPGVLVGSQHVADPASASAATDVALAYGSLSTVTCGSVISTTMGGGQTLLPNVYCLGAASTINGDLILDGGGDPTSIFIFKIDGALATTVNSRIILTNSASLCNVYWQVNGEVDLGDNSIFQGTILANGAINLLEGAKLLGRGLTQAGAISLHDNIVTIGFQPTASTITAVGPTTFCAGGSVTLSGNTGGTWSTGATTPSINVSAGGDFFVTNTTGCGSVNSNHITVTVNPQPIASVITAGGPTTFCDGGNVILSGNSGGTWSNGQTTPSITVTASGDYFVTNTNECGNVTSNHIVVMVNPQPVASIITAGSGTTFCAGGSVILSGNNGGTWSNGETGPSITVTASGDYFVTNTNACGNVISNHIIVTVNPLPNCSITGNNTICPGGSTQLCVPAGASGYLWSTGATTNCITASAGGTYSVTVTNENGCSSTCSILVTVTSTASCSITGNSTICPGGSTQLCVPAGASGYLWSTGATTNCITVSAAGTYSVTVTNSAGCSSTCSIAVTVTPAPSCSITGNSTICPGGSTQLCVAAGASAYLWSTGATTNCITVSAAGTYSVTVTNSAGCSSTCSIIVTVTPAPSCLITGNNVICTGGSTQLCAPSGTGYTYKWNTGATTSCIAASAAGTYSVTVTNSAGCSSTCSIIVTVTPAPSCLITGNNVICTGGSTQLCAPSGTGYTYKWNTGATTSCIAASAAGTYSVTVTNSAGCSSTCSIIVTVTPAPSCLITGNNVICTGGSTQLCAPAGTGYTYKWNTGATTSCIAASAAGTYSVTVTNPGGCSSTCSIIVSVTPAPSCTITGNSTICTGGSTQLCAPSGTGYTYKWSTGATTSCITVTTAGTYSITVTNAGGCSSTCSKTITTSPAPSCTITGNSSICVGGSTQLCAPAGCATYKWSTGATTSCITVTTAGTYSITVTNAGGCSSTCSKTVMASPAPSCTITGNSSICVGGSTQLCAPAGCATYKWSTGATTSCITVTTAGTYSITVTNAGGCSSTCSKTVTTSPAPSCTITGNSSICVGGSTQLCAPAGCATYKWSTGATTSCITVTTAGTYSITVTNAGGCSSTCSKTITTSPAPSCTITGNSSICVGGSTQLCAPAGCATYKWSTGATTSCITVTTAGTYSITVTNAGGCSSTCSKTVTTSPAPSCTITGNSSICVGGSTQLCAPAGCATYKWSTGATTSCITVTTAGTYSITVTNAGGCSSTCSKTITTSPAPSCTITGNSSICVGGSTQLCAPAGCASYKWSTGATTSCITVTTAGTYSITVTNAGGCSSTCSKTVTASPAPSCTITGNSSICIGGSTVLSAPAGCASYKWSTGATTSSITVTTAGTYSITVTNAGGCSSTCSKTVTSATAPSCTITGNSSICVGGSTVLSAPAGCASYKWSTGATTSSITVTTAGTYSITVTNAGGCSSTCSKTVTSAPVLSCSITGNLHPSVGQIISLCAPAGCATYKWSTGATTSCINVTCSGTYKVTVTNSGGCSSSCSAVVTYYSSLTGDGSIIALDKTKPGIANFDFKVNAYPNPFSSQAIIEFQNNESSSRVVIELYDITGNIKATLFDADVKKGMLYKAKVNAGNLASGIYTYRILTGKQVIIKKIILLK